MKLRFFCENSSDLDEIWQFVVDFIDVPCFLLVEDDICTINFIDDDF